MLKGFSPWQKLQYYLVTLAVSLFFICFTSQFLGYDLPASIANYVMVFWSIILIFIDPKELAGVIKPLTEVKEKKDEKTDGAVLNPSEPE